MRAVGKSFSERKCGFRRGDRQEESGQKLEELAAEVEVVSEKLLPATPPQAHQTS